MSVGDVISLFGGTGGGVGLIVLVLFITGHIVPKGRLDEMKEERDEWRSKSEIDQKIALALIEVASVTKETLAGIRKELSP